MPAASTYLTDAQLGQIAKSSYDYYINQGKRPHMQNLQARPMMDLVGKRIKKTKHPFINGTVNYNIETLSDRDFQEAYGRTEIDFSEGFFGDKFAYTGAQAFLTLEVVHDALADLGYEVASNADWKVPPRISKAQKLEIFEYLGNEFMRLEDDFDRLLDKYLHGDGTGTYSLPGLQSLFPTTNTSGSIGGKARASNVWARHSAETGLTSTSGGNLQSKLDGLVRECKRYARTGSPDVMVVGSSVLDAVKTYAKNNNLQLNTNLAGNAGTDLSIPDGSVKWDGVPMIWDPTIDDEASAKTGYILNSSTLELAYRTDKEFSRPTDQYNLRVSRFVMRGYYALICKQPNANAVFTVA